MFAVTRKINMDDHSLDLKYKCPVVIDCFCSYLIGQSKPFALLILKDKKTQSSSIPRREEENKFWEVIVMPTTI